MSGAAGTLNGRVGGWKGGVVKSVTGWWFAPKNKKLANGDGRPIVIGKTHTVKGDIVPCQNGLHLSKRPLDAVRYAPGPVAYKVRGSGIIVPHGNPIDKYSCSERTYIAGGVDCTDLLRRFARMCSLDVIHLWDAPDVVVQYLKTGNESLRPAAWAAAKAAWPAARTTAAWAAAKAAEAAGTDAEKKQNSRLVHMLNKAIKDK